MKIQLHPHYKVFESVSYTHLDVYKRQPTGCYFHPRCKYCQEICKTKSPEMTEGSHRYKCFFPLGNGDDEKGA